MNSGLTLSALKQSGQICMSTERIVVQRAVVDRFRPILKATAEKVFGSAAPALVLVNANPVAKNKTLVSDAISKGANVLSGDPEAQESSNTRMRPIILDGVTKEMDIYMTESFGPTVSILVVDTEEEAIEIANDTEYGLTASVYTEDLRRGLRVAHQIESGYVSRI